MPVTFREDVDESLAAMLAAGRSQTDAANTLGISTRTVARRLEQPEFRAMLDRFKAAAVEQATSTLSRNMNGAALELARLMSTSEDEKIRLAAANSVIANGLKARNAEEMERAIADLTDRLSAVERKKASR